MKIITKRINSIAKKFGYRFVKIEKYFKNKTKTMFKIDITGRFIIKK